MDPEREGAKRRTDKRNPADVTPQEPQILQRLYEPHVGPVTGQGSNFTMKNIALKPKKKPLGTTFSSSTSSSGLKKNPSISTLLTSNDSMDSKNLPAPILSSSKSAATLLTPTLHPSLQNASDKTKKLLEKANISASTTSLVDVSLPSSIHEEVSTTKTMLISSNSMGKLMKHNSISSSSSFGSSMISRNHMKMAIVEGSFTSSLNLDPRYLKEFKAGNFFYLRRKKESDLVMYGLEIVEHFEIDRNDYFTMSMEGITHFTKDFSEFWTLDQWEFEYSRFMQMLKIPFFQQYKKWKNFNVWKQSIRTFKMFYAKNLLEEKLFFLQPFLQQTLLELKKNCLEIGKMELILFQSNKIYTLKEFEMEQKKQREKILEKMIFFSSTNLHLCIKACDDVIDFFLEKNNISAEQKMTFMERAALRKECRNLTNFLRLTDFITIDATIQLTIGSFQRLLQVLSQNKTTNTTTTTTAAATVEVEVVVPVSSIDSITVAKSPPTNKSSTMTTTKYNGNTTSLAVVSGNISNNGNKNGNGNGICTDTGTGTIFSVIIEMDHPSNTLVATPDHDAWNSALQNALKEALRIVETPSRHLGHESLAPYTTASAEDDGKDVWSIEQLSVALILNEDVQFSNLINDIFEAFDEAFDAVEEYMEIFFSFHKIYLENEKQMNHFMKNFQFASIDFFTESIEKYQKQKNFFLQEIPEQTKIGLFKIESMELKKIFLPNPEKCISKIRFLIPEIMKQSSHELLEIFNDFISPIAFSIVSTPEQFVKKVIHMQNVSLMLVDLKNRYRRIYEMGILMDTYDWRVPDDIKEDIILMKEGLLSLEANLIRFESELDTETARFSQLILEQFAPLNQNVILLQQKLEHTKLFTLKTPIEEVLNYLKLQEKQLFDLKEEAKQLQNYQVQLKQTVYDFQQLEEISQVFEIQKKLWYGLNEWQQIMTTNLDTPFEQIEVNSILKQVQNFVKIAYLSQKMFPENEVAIYLQNQVDTFKNVLPVVTDLRSKSLQNRHWNQIHQTIGFQLKGEKKLKLQFLIQQNIMQYADKINTITMMAQQEAVLEEMLKKVTTIWANTEFEVKIYKDTKDVYILGSIDEIVVKLDDSIVTISTILGSRFVQAIQEEVENWKKKLETLQETLEEWLMVQKNWMYLENIFSAPDIQRQLPDASKMFSHVDISWKTIMRRTNENPHVLTAGTFPGIKETLIQHNVYLDKIQKNLEDYLETKRMAFPRFYFLSNDELLEILAQSKNPQAVQPHLRKCFENLIKLDFGDVPGSIDMLGMISSENERVPLGKNLKARGNVEDWLKALETSMKQSLYKLMKAGLMDYETKTRADWVCEHPGQVVATVAQMTWAKNTEEALQSEKPIAEMEKWYHRVVFELNELIIKIRGDLTSLERKIIVALVTTDVHARDIVECLWKEQVDSIGNFIWQQQLRYYWNTQTDDVLICHSDSTINYGYEYMGATSRLVITPLTDRCWMTLTGAYGLKLGAAPAGPAGTGKTESSKDLAKAMAIQCVVFNCSDQIDYKMMGKLFRGLAQAGNWTCLDEFNRIDIEVLSVVAQQLLILREGRIQGKEHINFMGIEILLKDHHVIVTMNPGYAGRTELPDNLKVCFRPVSMMVPDYALIAEIMLFAEGFSDARTLSKKMCKLYILCSEQLSQQPHYDYGLRAVKSVLVMAGTLKRANPNLNEDVTLIRALRDSNVPKFLADDLPLFQAIVLDLFPGVDIPPNDYGELQTALETEIQKAGLQKIPAYIGKVIQLFDIFNVRFGGTLVGPTGAGKTSCYRTLQSTMTALRAQGSKNPVYQTVHTRILNPKCISMGELYGEFNEATQEWHDGLASTIMREAVADETSDVKWTVFDGPIDALWIENMNTVLDDNMTLCLANGERIKLKNEMKMLFEVMDLAVASPATVSRIGVVYMTGTDLGWMPFVKTWMEKELPKDFPKDAFNRFETNINNYMEKTLQFIRKKCHELVPTVDINLITSFCRLFGTLFFTGGMGNGNTNNGSGSFTNGSSGGGHFTGIAYQSMKIEDLLDILDKVFAFSLFWSLGASIISEKHEEFDIFMRELMSEMKLQIPNTGFVFDYFIDLKELKFVPWTEMVPKFQYDSSIPYFKMIVPTPDTVRFTFLLKTLTASKINAYVTGVTGTGKTVIIQDLLRDLQEGPRVIASTHHSDENVGETSIVPVALPVVSNTNGVSYLAMNINFSAQTSSLVTQMTIESKLEKKRKNLLGPVAGKRMIIFVDDVNLPTVEQYGAQPPIELLRQFLDFGGFYDREKLFWKEITDTMLLASAAPAGGGRSQCTPRFIRHFHVLSMYPAGEKSLKLIFSSILGGFLEKFVPSVKTMRDGIISSIIEIYHRVTLELLPTPNKFHYTFNLRDVSKVIQGILMITPSKCNEPDLMNRLWVHEVTRVFEDRLNNVFDQKWFEELVCSLLTRNFGCNWTSETLFHGSCPLIFGDFLKPGTSTTQSLYEFCGNDLTKITKIMDDFLENYNITFSNKMNLVFFRDAISHLVRLVRILRQPRGNAMLIGVGGSGKQSLGRLAAFIVEAKCIQIEITRGYGPNEFHEDLKKIMIHAGVGGNPTVFLFTDSQIVEENFLEDINNILNSGEVPNLFPQEEMDRIIADMRPIVKAMEIPETRDNCISFFIERVRNYLHIVLAMSPVGSSLRVRCRAFPSLINCCTIDWYMNWPKEALQSVAKSLLSKVILPSEEIRFSLIEMCSFVHTSSNDFGEMFLLQLQRYVYTTPKSYLDLIHLYLKMLEEKRIILQNLKKKMKIGVNKLEETNEIVDHLKKELIELQPILLQKTLEAEHLLQQVSIDQKAASIVKEKVSFDEAIVTKQTEEIALIQADAQKDLDIAMPSFQNAIKALDALSKNDITEVKSFTKPPEAVEQVMNTVCLLLNEKQNWETAKKLLSETNFLEKLKNFDKDNISNGILKKLSKNINEPNMAVENVSKVSKAATSLCLWCHAMDVYSKVAKEMGPKKEKLIEMNAKLIQANDFLNEKRQELLQVHLKIQQLEKKCQETIQEKNQLIEETQKTKKRLERAEKLIAGLFVEGKRWKENVVSLSSSILALIGDIFLAAACISYYGPFTGLFRQKIIEKWLEQAKILEIPCSFSFFSLSNTLGSPIEIREWQLNGLPTDSTSTDNAILVTRGERWPLMIDPQGQANKWIKKTFGNINNLEVIKMTNNNLLRILETCIRNGKTLLIEDIDEILEPALEPILQKAIFKQNGRLLIHLGDSDIDYDPCFQFFITTKLSNPHFLPEIYIKMTVINFTVTMEGLEEQLLGEVVRHERPDIEEKKNHLVMIMAQDRRQLKEIEDRILKQLSESNGNILDDQELIDTLQNSNQTSKMIKEKVFESEKTEIEINQIREQYRCVATRGSILYFVIANLAWIDPMYQYSLNFFQRLFNHCFQEANFSDILQERLSFLIEYQTKYIYINICRGLFERHKVLFSMLICCKIMLHAGKITSKEWFLYLRGGTSIQNPNPNPWPDRLSEAQWNLLEELETLVTKKIVVINQEQKKEEIYYGFAGICQSICNNQKEWNIWLQEEEKEKTNLTKIPKEYEAKLNFFQKILLFKALAEERVPKAILNLITHEMGKEFGTIVPTSMEEIYTDTDQKTPCIFVLSAGADPTGMLLRFAKEKGFMERLHLISLGQGQGSRAEKLIETSCFNGDWVLLQNCHLAKSWMPKLEKIVEELAIKTEEQCISTFRLFLTSFPASYFPVTILQNGIKLTNEPPKGIRANLVRSFNTLISQETLNFFQELGTFNDQLSKDFVWKRLLCSLTFFHAIIQERRKFGPLGWNIRYEFNDTDLETSLASLKKFLEQQSIVPWDAMKYVTGQINYGGRVTDDWDRRCLMSILNNFYTKDVLKTSEYYFSSSGIYRIPSSCDHDQILNYLNELPPLDNPEVFGMHDNANVTYERNESLNMTRIILSLEPRDGGGSGGRSGDQRVIELAASILESLPPNLSVEEAGPTTFKTRIVAGTTVMDSLATVLSQELVKFNTLLNHMRSSLVDIQKAINGLIVMSSDLDNMYMAFLNGKVPQIWSAVGFASLKPLGSWVRDLLERLTFFRMWLVQGEPVVFNLNVFFFPQGFMTGTLQNYARKYLVAIDSLAFTFRVMKEQAHEITQSPSDGVYINSLWLEGARWSNETNRLEDAKPGEMFSSMNIIHFLPSSNVERNKAEYPCPVYKTSVRQGTLSTTGISTNFVVAVYLPTEKKPDYWVMNGAAFLLNLDT